eukprot:3446088-Amphidinium_carterae.1
MGADHRERWQAIDGNALGDVMSHRGSPMATPRPVAPGSPMAGSGPRPLVQPLGASVITMPLPPPPAPPGMFPCTLCTTAPSPMRPMAPMVPVPAPCQM